MITISENVVQCTQTWFGTGLLLQFQAHVHPTAKLGSMTVAALKKLYIIIILILF